MTWQPRPDSQRPGYTVGKRIGQGGMAEVFEAELRRPPFPPQKVAFKRLLPGLRGDPQQRRKLRREAQIGCALSHENIVRTVELLDLGDEDALVLEFLDGLSAHALLGRLCERSYRLQPALAAHILRGVFSALHYLQSCALRDRPMVHADLSLENIMLTKEGRVLLIDFGLSEETESRPEQVGQNDDLLTGLYAVGGKPSYLPPSGFAEKTTPYQDMYAAGVCAWELLCGRRFPALPPGCGRREIGSLIAFAALGQPGPVWLLLRDLLWPTGPAVSASDAMALCANLAKDQPTQGALSRLLRFLDGGNPDLPQVLGPHLLAVDQPLELSHRLKQAFSAQAVQVWSFQQNAKRFLAGQGQMPRPPQSELLGEALAQGWVLGPEGLLCAKTSPNEVVVIDPGQGRVYDNVVVALLKRLLHAPTRSGINPPAN